MFDLASYDKHSYLNDPTVPEFDRNIHLLVMDGNCTLCSGGRGLSVRWIIKTSSALPP